MSNLLYTLLSAPDGESNLTVFIPGDPEPYVAHSTHTNFDKLVAAVLAGDTDLQEIRDLFDVSVAISEVFARLTDRVSIENGHVTLDGDPVHSSLSDQIVRFYENDVDDWKPLVRFFENVAANPQAHSREQLYDWLGRHEFTITDDGKIVGYKGVKRDAEHGYVSIHAGPGYVDGVPVNGHIPNRIGSVISISRSAVHHDPSVGCSTGLHVGTWDYASGFSQGAVLEVHVDPRDVVSVPTDCNWQKVRTCRYEVVNIIDRPYTTPVLASDGDDDWDPDEDDYDYCDECDEHNADCVCDESDF